MNDVRYVIYSANITITTENEQHYFVGANAMRKLLRRVFAVTICLLVGLISAGAVLVWSISKDWKHPVPLTAGLRGVLELTGDFNERIQAAFPIGSAVHSMEAELQRQGFARRDWNFSSEQENYAQREELALLCNTTATVYWRAGQDGHITSIRGRCFRVCL